MVVGGVSERGWPQDSGQRAARRNQKKQKSNLNQVVLHIKSGRMKRAAATAEEEEVVKPYRTHGIFTIFPLWQRIIFFALKLYRGSNLIIAEPWRRRRKRWRGGGIAMCIFESWFYEMILICLKADEATRWRWRRSIGIKCDYMHIRLLISNQFNGILISDRLVETLWRWMTWVDAWSTWLHLQSILKKGIVTKCFLYL